MIDYHIEFQVLWLILPFSLEPKEIKWYILYWYWFFIRRRSISWYSSDTKYNSDHHWNTYSSAFFEFVLFCIWKLLFTSLTKPILKLIGTTNSIVTAFYCHHCIFLQFHIYVIRIVQNINKHWNSPAR